MILILTQCFPTRIGGIESLISNLALSLSNREKIIVLADQYDVINDALFDKENKNKFLIHRIGGLKFFRKRKKIKKAKFLIKTKNIKFVIGDSWKSLELCVDYLNIKNIPSLCLAHGNELISNKKGKIKRIKNTLDKVSCIIANSIFTKNLIKKISDNKTEVIHPGASDLRYISKEEIPNVGEKKILLTLARLEKRKGHTFIIKCIKKLLNDFPDLIYVIAGEGSELQSLKRLVKTEKLENNIIFVGKVNESQKKFLFEKTKLMIMPTIDESKKNSIEGFGIAYLEAAFFAIPSIASNVGGTPEAVINDNTGKIITDIKDLYDSIRGLLENDKLRLKLGSNAQKRALQNFTWDFISKKYLSIMNKEKIN